MKKIFFIILSVFFILSCKNEKLEMHTRIFGKYMKKEFDLEIKEKPSTFSELLERKDIKNHNKYSFITSDEKKYHSLKKIGVNVLKDENNKLNFLNMELANVVILKTKNKKVIFNKSIDLDDLPVSQYLNNFF
ncbi:MAG: hypothetical protein B6I24_02385 [Bacteroidetes bacterium 4572_128]|nr:MAG: hypothetical protein B6I24_02385 [Bacteroidetes bacterium 4572_128]